VLVAQPDVRFYGNIRDAEKEYAEAAITLAFVRGDALPTAEELGIEDAPYLNGMAEAASELRRAALDELRRSNLPAAEHLLATMDDVYSMLLTIDFADALTGGLRRTTDALRAVLERTRSDLTTAAVAMRLQAAIEKASPATE
jgi:translin